MKKFEERYVRLNFICIVSTFLLILAGGIVRSTGSGMGCPDWPKCFGQYIPPTSLSQLPNGYKEEYLKGRLLKNERFAKTLERIGKKDLADSIRKDATIKIPEDFNPSKTWTEYINRLIGAITGILLFVLAIFSLPYRKRAKRMVALSVLNLLLVGFQAWLGSIVVSTNLLAWVVTLHMLLALLVIAILIYTYHYSLNFNKPQQVIMWRLAWLKLLNFITITLSVVQVVLGTEVREAIDRISGELVKQRNTWITEIGQIFIYHRDVAILVVVSNLIVYKMVKDRFNGRDIPLKTINVVLIVLSVQVISGLILAYLAIPPVAQAFHILFSTLLFAAQFYLFLLVFNTKTYKPQIS